MIMLEVQICNYFPRSELLHSLSYGQIQEYLEFLQEKGLIMYEEGVQHYKLSEKGLHFLHVYEQISELVSLAKTPTAVVQQPLDDNQSTTLSIPE